MSEVLRGLELQQGVHRLERRRSGASVPAAVADPGPPRGPDLQAQLDEARARLEEDQRSWRREAEQDLAAARQRALQEAQAAGHAQGLAQAREAHQQKLQELDAVIGKLGALLGEQLAAAEDLAVAIAYESVVRIVGETVARPEGVRAVVAQAIAAARQQERLVVRVPADDYHLLIEALPASDPLARPGIEIRPDAQLADGGCVIDTDAGQLDARLATQLAALRTVLLQARGQGPARGE